MSSFLYKIADFIRPLITAEPQQPTKAYLPPDLKRQLFSFLKLEEVTVCSLVNKEWSQHIARDEALWSNLLKRTFPVLFQRRDLAAEIEKRPLITCMRECRILMNIRGGHYTNLPPLLQKNMSSSISLAEGALFNPSTKEILKYDRGKWERQPILLGNRSISCLCVPTGGESFCIGRSDGIIEIGKYEKGAWVLQATFAAHTGEITCLLLADEETLFTGSYDNTIKVWKYEKGEWTHKQSLGLTGRVYSLQLTADRTLFAGLQHGLVAIYTGTNDEWTFKRSLVVSNNGSSVTSLHVLADGRTLFVGSNNTRVSSVIKLDANHKLKTSCDKYHEELTSTYLAANQTLCIGSSTGAVKTIRDTAELCTLQLSRRPITALSIRKDGLLFAADDKRVTMRNLAASKEAILWQTAQRLQTHPKSALELEMRISSLCDPTGSVRDDLGFSFLDESKKGELPKSYMDRPEQRQGKLEASIMHKLNPLNFLGLESDKEHIIKTAQVVLDALKELSWSARKIALEFALTPDEDTASTEFLLVQFAKLSEEIKERAYGELYRMYQVKGIQIYGAWAFCNEKGYSATNAERSQALPRSSNSTP